MIDKLNQRWRSGDFLGDGVPVFRELIEEKMTVPYSFAPAHVNKQRAAAVAALGEIYYSQGKQKRQWNMFRIICVFRRLKESVLSGRRQRPTVIHDVSRMSVEDLEQVVEIEKALFSDPWTKEGFLHF